MVLKSERLKKLESELYDLEHWLKLGLVPKKDIEKHKQEIEALKMRVSEEKRRLQELKESGEVEEYVAPKRGSQGRQAYQEPHTIPGIDADTSGMTDAGLDLETESYDTTEHTNFSEGSERSEESTLVYEDEDDPFSDKNRWRRGILEDPEADSW